MLLSPEFCSKKYYANEKQINATRHPMIILDYFPCLFHFLAPVNIIEYKYGIIGGPFKQLLKISFSWLFTMIAVNKSKINRRQATNDRRQC